MKKIFLCLVFAIFTVINVNAQNDNLVKITSDYQKMVDIGAAIFRFNDLSFATDGLCYIKYKDDWELVDYKKLKLNGKTTSTKLLIKHK